MNDADGNVPMPGTRIAWMRQDGTQAQATVDQVLVEPGAVWVFVIHDDGAWSVLNPRRVKLWVVGEASEKTRGKQR